MTMTRTPGKIVTMLMAETKTALGGGAEEETKESRSAPAYLGVVPKQRLLSTVSRPVGGRDIEFRIKCYTPNFIVIEGTMDVPDMFTGRVLDLKAEMLAASRAILSGYETYKDFDEEYGFFCVSEYAGVPEKFFAHAPLIASFLKSEKEPLDENEIKQTFAASIKYGKDDLLIADWDGAFIFESDGKFDETIELLELGNLQLLRYRVLDYELDRRLAKLLRLLAKQKDGSFWSLGRGEFREVVGKIIQARSRSMVEFESVERNVKLIGDWYSARVFGLMEAKFHLPEWRRRIQAKFEALEDVYTMASENFALSVNKRMETILLAGWFVLLIGWFALLFVDFLSYVR